MRPSAASAELVSVGEALDRLLERLGPVETERVPLEEAGGRVTAEEVRADRPSPPADVSAMDGYAVRFEELLAGSLPVRGEAAIGRDIRALEPGTALRIFTGGPVPDGADSVVKREDLAERPDRIELRVDPSGLARGDHIRRKGENVAAGERVVEAGRVILGPVAGALATFGAARPLVRRRVRVSIVTTGDELVGVDEPPTSTGLRDSNSSALRSLLAPLRWAEVASTEHAPDEPDRIAAPVRRALATADAILVSGGVSMGDHDHVPAVLESLGCRVVFHRLAIRPGKPVLGAVGPDGQLVLGLPGNPVSALVTGRRLAFPALELRAGIEARSGPGGRVELAPGVDAPHSLTRFPLVRRTGPARAEPVASRGSGDLVAAARSDGFVEVPSGQMGSGPFDYFPWVP